MSRSPTTGLDRASPSRSTVSLLEIESYFGWLLTDEERDAAGVIDLPVRTIDPPGDLHAWCQELGSFGAILVDGLLVQELRIGDHVGIRVLGPGDTVLVEAGSDTPILNAGSWVGTGQVRAVFMDTGMLSALSRWPRLMIGLYRQMGQQIDRLAAQLAICQLPRVEDRVLAMMWLLAGTWGRVTSAGTRLPLDLTHEALGKMIGARRPTVTLALRELADRGAMLRQADGWLLLDSPPGDGTLGARDGTAIRR